jgi:hypothetical protein
MPLSRPLGVFMSTLASTSIRPTPRNCAVCSGKILEERTSSQTCDQLHDKGKSIVKVGASSISVASSDAEALYSSKNRSVFSDIKTRSTLLSITLSWSVFLRTTISKSGSEPCREDCVPNPGLSDRCAVMVNGCHTVTDTRPLAFWSYRCSQHHTNLSSFLLQARREASGTRVICVCFVRQVRSFC